MHENRENLQLSGIVAEALVYHMANYQNKAGISISKLSRRTGISESAISSHRSASNASVPEFPTILIYTCVLGEDFLNDILDPAGFCGVRKISDDPHKEGLALIEQGTKMIKGGM